MAVFRYVHTNFWQDAKVLEEFTPEDKFFFLYLLTNEHTTQVGVYQITRKQIAFEMGYSPEAINSLMDRFINHHKIIRYNADTREISIKNWGKYNLNKGGKPVEDCLKKELQNIKDISLLEYILPSIANKNIKNLFLKFLYDTSNDTVYDTLHDTSTIREQKQEENANVSKNAGFNDTSTMRGQKEKEKEKEKEEEVVVSSKEKNGNTAAANYIKFFSSNFHPITQYEAEMLKAYEEDGLENKVIQLALEEAVERNIRTIKYVKSILNRWLENNLKTVEAVQADKKEFERKKKGDKKDGSNKQCIEELENEGNGFTV